MTLNDIITKNLHLIDSQGNLTMKFVKEVVKQYSEVYAKKVLEKASEEVVVDFNILGVDNILAAYHNNLSKGLMSTDLEVFALNHSITDIELPEHE